MRRWAEETSSKKKGKSSNKFIEKKARFIIANASKIRIENEYRDLAEVAGIGALKAEI